MKTKYVASCGDWSSIIKAEKPEDLKRLIMKEINKVPKGNIQLGFYIYIREFGDKEENNKFYCLANEVLVPRKRIGEGFFNMGQMV